MLLDEASVTGTANIVMAAVLAKEKQLFIMLPVSLICSSCKMLNSMGANITGVGSNLLVIEGVKILADVSIGFYQT
jgi:UDP-N-acetylglucosamine 1-carboxyvinyltransferase